MLDYLKSYLLFGNRFCGVEHSLKNDQDIVYTSLLKRTKKEVDNEDCFVSKTVKEVADKLPKNQHILLVINNDQVLTKSLKTEQIDGLNLINRAFPNINISEFYYEIIHQNDSSFVSICRKQYVEQLIKAYQENNIHVISFSLGNAISSNTVRYIDNTSIFTSNANILIQDNCIKTISDTDSVKEEDYNINGLEVSNNYFLSFSAALSSIINNYSTITNYQDKKDAFLSTYKEVRFFNQFLKMGLTTILVILLINFLFYNFYFNQVNTLSQSSQLNQTTKSKIIKLNEEVGKAQKTSEDLLKSSTSKSSFYIDAIVHSLPKSVLLSEIIYQPLEKRIKEDKAILLKENTIMVSGESNNSSQYSQWIILLENMNWIEKVTVEAYNGSKTMYSNFSIKINIKP